jgi:hypothetical protein
MVILCKDDACVDLASYGKVGKGNKPEYCSIHKKANMNKKLAIICLFDDCENFASHGKKGKNNLKEYCKIHKNEEENLCNKNEPECQAEGCYKVAKCGIDGKKPYLYCDTHKLEGMKNGRKKSSECIEPGCDKERSYGYVDKNGEGVGPKQYCVTHAKPEMVNRKKIKCKEKKCDKGALFNYNREEFKGKGLYCDTHKLPDMINVMENRRCEVEGCTTRPLYGFNYDEPATRCEPHALKGMFSVSNSQCKVKDENGICRKFPTHNYPDAIGKKFCEIHALEGMIKVVYNTCKFENCGKTAVFNIEGRSKGIRCSKHKLDNMINVYCKKCEEPGCIKEPSFNIPGENSKPLYCKDHKLEGMKDVKNKKCLKEGCDKIPTFNYCTESRGIYCDAHKLEGMINVRSNRCLEKGCDTLASYNYPTEKKLLYCNTHKLPGMIDVSNRHCADEECTKRALYGIPGNSVSHCPDHKTDNMINNPNKRCIVKNCNETAIYGDFTATHCELHALPEQRNLILRKCKNCPTIDIVDLDGFCFACNPNNFNRVRLAKQKDVEHFLRQNDDLPLFDQTDRVIGGGDLGRERPDFLWDMEEYCVIVEVDEEQHIGRACECEQVRMKNISEMLKKPTWFIRYNPDKYKEGDSNRKKVGENKRRRQQKLKEWVGFCLNNNPIHENIAIGVIYLYFDGWTGEGERFTLQKND